MTDIATTSDTDFAQDVLKASRPVLVEFTATWCPPCKALAPVLADVAVERAGQVQVVAVDIDASPATAQRYSVLSVPTMILFTAGAARARLVGYRPKARLLGELDQALIEAEAVSTDAAA